MPRGVQPYQRFQQTRWRASLTLAVEAVGKPILPLSRRNVGGMLASALLACKDNPMARYRPINMSPQLLPVDFSRQILPGSFEYALCHLLDHEMDLSGFDHRYRNEEGGAPAYAPALLLKIVLLAYSCGLVSARAMESACRHHVLFMAVCGGATPHFTTLAAFVRTGSEAIGRLFTQVLLVCDRQGLIGRQTGTAPRSGTPPAPLSQ